VCVKTEKRGGTKGRQGMRMKEKGRDRTEISENTKEVGEGKKTKNEPRASLRTFTSVCSIVACCCLRICAEEENNKTMIRRNGGGAGGGGRTQRRLKHKEMVKEGTYNIFLFENGVLLLLEEEKLSILF
jgi:hypothetical protein